MNQADKNIRPDFDKVVKNIADYVAKEQNFSQIAMETAHYCLFDSIACALLALDYQKCRNVLGPIIQGAECKRGARVIGTNYTLEPSQAGFNLTAMIRWLDYNDTWLAAEWGHPSDNIGGILALCDFLNRNKKAKFTIEELLKFCIKAYEIQGVLALVNAFNRSGIDHVVLVRIASCAVAAKILGANEAQLLSAISNAWADGGMLRTYRHAPNTGSRKSWAAGDSVRRAIQLALLSMKDSTSYPSVITAKTWGYSDALMRGKEIRINRQMESYVMENILFKISYPAEFHAQTAVEAAIKLHPQVKNKLEQIEKIKLYTQESAVRIISKSGPLYNEADRDHCLQYMAAIGLIYGDLTAAHYEDKIANEPIIDQIRNKMEVKEDPSYSKDYLDQEKRSIANAIEVFFKNGEKTQKIEVHYPIGHKFRRKEGIPLLHKKYQSSINKFYKKNKSQQLSVLINNFEDVKKLKVDDFVSKFI